MRRFILIDPCLCDLGSHPYQYCRDLLDAAERAGFACAAVAHRGFRPRPDQWPSDHRLEASLSMLGHSKYTAFGELDRLTADGRPRLRIAWPWAERHAERRRRQRIDTFAREIAAVVGDVRPGDIVFVATASELDLAGLSQAIRDGRPPRGVSWHVQFHYQLFRGFLDDFARQERRIDRIRRLTRRAIDDAAPHEIRLHVTTDELASQHRRLGVSEVGVLPYPVRVSAIAAATRPPRRDRFRIAALGDARPEKQSQLLADVAERVAADPMLSPLATLAVQSNLGFPSGSRAPADRAVLASLERLSAMPREHVELLGGPLCEEEYARQLAEADAVLLAYDQDRYRCRCSGVTLEAIASGALPIVTGGGSMARLLAEPVAGHTAEVVSASRRFPGVGAGRMKIRAGRPLHLAIEIPGEATAILASAEWPAKGDEALQLPGVRVAVEIEGISRRTLPLQPDPSGRPARGLVPIAPGPSDRPGGSRRRVARVAVEPLPGAAAVELESFATDPLDTGMPRPCSAAGIVVAPGDGLLEAVVEAVREIVRFGDHYRRSAASHAAAVGERHAGDAVLRAIVAANPLQEGVPPR